MQLAHNYRDKEAGQFRANVLYNFGREEELDTNALKRLINSINRYLGPEEALASQESELLKFISSKPLGGTYFLDGLWKRLGIKETIDQLLQNRSYQMVKENLEVKEIVVGNSEAQKRYVLVRNLRQLLKDQ